MPAAITHLFVETELLGHPDVSRLQARNRGARVVAIDNYRTLFDRPRQDFQLQKRGRRLILARHHGRALYPGTNRLDSFEEERIFYSDPVRNCVYNCDYCFLQGMHPSGYTVLFIGDEATLQAVDAELARGPIYLCISYVTDLLAVETLIPYCARWIEHARTRPDLTIEIRTKSDNYAAIRAVPPSSKVFLTWSMSPQPIAARYERGTASFPNRLFAAATAAADGWPLRLCFDPILPVEGWRDLYAACIDEIFRRLPAAKVDAIGLGTFRMNTTYLDRIRRARIDTDIVHQPYVREERFYVLDPSLADEALQFVRERLETYIAGERIHLI